MTDLAMLTLDHADHLEALTGTWRASDAEKDAEVYELVEHSRFTALGPGDRVLVRDGHIVGIEHLGDTLMIEVHLQMFRDPKADDALWASFRGEVPLTEWGIAAKINAPSKEWVDTNIVPLGKAVVAEIIPLRWPA